MTIQDRIKFKRTELGLSQEELAFRVGYKGRSVISKVESGERDIKASMVTKYADALRVSRTWLITGKEEENSATNESSQIKNASEHNGTDAVKDIKDRFDRLPPDCKEKVLVELIKSLSSH